MKQKTISDIAHPEYSALRTLRSYMKWAMAIGWLALLLGFILQLNSK